MIALTLASVAAFVTFGVHTFVGTRFAVPPLVGAGAAVPRATIWLNYLCWHIVTGLLLLFALCLAGVAGGAFRTR